MCKDHGQRQVIIEVVVEYYKGRVFTFLPKELEHLSDAILAELCDRGYEFTDTKSAGPKREVESVVPEIIPRGDILRAAAKYYCDYAGNSDMYTLDRAFIAGSDFILAKLEKSNCPK